MDFHSEIPLVTLFGLMHFFIALTLFVLCRAWSSDYSGVDNGTAMHNQPCVFKPGCYIGEDLFTNLMLFQKVTEL